MADYSRFTFTIANDQYRELPQAGKMVRILDLTANIQFSVENQQLFQVKKGMKIRSKDFFRFLRFYNDSGADCSVDVAISDEEVDDLSFTVVNTVTVNSGDVVSDVADVTVNNAATQILAADTTRNAVIITNTGAQNMRVGGSTVTATRGAQVLPGGSITLETGGAVYGCAETGSTTAAVTTIKD